MSSSYKPVLLLAILAKVDEHGRARLDDVVLAFHAFYLDRLQSGLPVERTGMRMQQAGIIARRMTSDLSCSACLSASSSRESTSRTTSRTWPTSGFRPLFGASSRPRIGRRSAANASERYPTIMSALDPDRCPFCAMPSDRIVESNEHAFVVLDAYPVSPGHSLVISRRHVADIFDLTADRDRRHPATDSIRAGADRSYAATSGIQHRRERRERRRSDGHARPRPRHSPVSRRFRRPHRGCSRCDPWQSSI